MSSAGVRVQLCGRLEVELDGEPRAQELPGRQGRLLFAYLALNRHRPIRRDELLTVLWPDGSAPERADALLSPPLSRLRKVLGHGRLEGREQLTLALGEGAVVDWETLTTLLDSAREALEHRDWNAAGVTADAALAIADGGLLPGLEADWIEEWRAQLADRRLEALEMVAVSGLGRGGAELARAEEAARTAVDIAPFRESARVALIDVLIARGNHAEALRAFDDARRLLMDELGSVPGPALTARHERLLAGNAAEPTASLPASPASEGATLPDRLAAAAATPWVGRSEHLALLERELEVARAGETRLDLITGEAGIGKTRLLAQLAERAHGCSILYGRCDEEELVPFGPWIGSLGGYLAGVSDEALEPLVGGGAPYLSRLLPELRARLPMLAEAPTGDAESERYRLFVAVTDLIRRLARGGPILAIIDDLHWADRSSLMLARHLATAGSLGPVLMVGTYRDTDLTAGDPLSLMLADLERERPIPRIALTGFAETDVAELARAQGQELEPEAAHEVREETQGNPLFVKQLLRHIEEGGARRADGGYGLSAGIRDVIARRVARLPSGSRDVLTIGALIGRDFDFWLVAAVSDASENELLEVLDAAVRAGILVEVPSAPGSYSFVHALLRTALEDELTTTRRARLHRRIGEAIEAHGQDRRGPRLEDLARHFLAAGPEEADRAVLYAEKAGDLAMERLAYEEAVELLTGAVDMRERDEPVDDGELSRLLLLLADAHARAGSHEEARRTHARAADAARRGGAAETFARAALGHGGGALERFALGDPETVALLREALDLLPDADSSIRAQALAGLGAAVYLESPEDAPAPTRAAIEMARRLGDDEALAAALEAAQFAFWGPGRGETRRALAEELVEVTERLGTGARRAYARMFMAIIHFELCDLEGARASIARHAEVARRLQQPEILLQATSFRAMLALHTGDWELAEQSTGELTGPRAAALDFRQNVGVHTMALCSERGTLGDHAEMFAALLGETSMEGWRCVLSWALAQAGQLDAARAELATVRPNDFAALRRDSNFVPAVAAAAHAVAELGDPELAGELEPLLRPYDATWVMFGAGCALGPVAYYVGLLNLIPGNLDEAVRAFELALRKCQVMHARPYEAHTLFGLSRALGRRAGPGDVERAGELRERALEIANELDMTRLLRRAASD